MIFNKKTRIFVVGGAVMSMALLISVVPKDAEACCGAAAAAINSQTSAQATQHSALLLRLSALGERITGAVQDSANKINATTKKTAELQTQQKKSIFEINNNTAKTAVCNGGGTSNANSVIAKDKTKTATLVKVDEGVKDDAGNTAGDLLSKTVANSKMHEQRRLLVDEHNKNYCSDNDKKAGYCVTVATKDLQNADLRADRYFLNVYDNGLTTNKDANASKLFYQYIVGSDSTTIIPAKLVKESDKAKQLRAKQLELAAYGSVPKYILAKVQSERKKNKSSSDLGKLLGLDNIKEPSLIQILTEFSSTEASKTLEEYGKQGSVKAKTSFFQEKSLRAMGFTNYMLVKQYIQMQELSTLFASKLAFDLKPSYASLQEAINNVDAK